MGSPEFKVGDIVTPLQYSEFGNVFEGSHYKVLEVQGTGNFKIFKLSNALGIHNWFYNFQFVLVSDKSKKNKKSKRPIRRFECL